MRVLAVNQFYAPDHAATSQLLTELCEDLVSTSGDEVTVIASRGTYLGGAALPATETIAGVRIERAWATSLGKDSLPRRLSDYLSFWCTAVARSVVTERPEVILVVTSPSMVATGVTLLNAARGVPVVIWSQDVYPDIAVAFDVVSARHPMTRAIALAQRATYRASTGIVALSPGMAARLVAAGAPEDRVGVVPNWADGRDIAPLPPEQNPFRREHGLAGRFVAMYSGNFGVGHEFETFLGAAAMLADRRPEVLFLFVGEGARRAEVERLARGAPNIRFLPYQPRSTLRYSLAAADVHLLSLREALEGLIVPSKLYGALAAGRPVAYVGPARCEAAQVIGRHDLGWTGRPGDVEGLARALEVAASSPAWCAERGARARAVFEREYDRPIAIARWRKILARAADERVTEPGRPRGDGAPDELQARGRY